MKQGEEIFPVTPSATEQSGGRLGASGKIHSVLKPRHKGNTNEAEVFKRGEEEAGENGLHMDLKERSYVVASVSKEELQQTPLLSRYAPLSFAFSVKPHRQ